MVEGSTTEFEPLVSTRLDVVFVPAAVNWCDPCFQISPSGEWELYYHLTPNFWAWACWANSVVRSRLQRGVLRPEHAQEVEDTQLMIPAIRSLAERYFDPEDAVKRSPARPRLPTLGFADMAEMDAVFNFCPERDGPCLMINKQIRAWCPKASDPEGVRQFLDRWKVQT